MQNNKWIRDLAETYRNMLQEQMNPPIPPDPRNYGYHEYEMPTRSDLKRGRGVGKQIADPDVRNIAAAVGDLRARAGNRVAVRPWLSPVVAALGAERFPDGDHPGGPWGGPDGKALDRWKAGFPSLKDWGRDMEEVEPAPPPPPPQPDPRRRRREEAERLRRQQLDAEERERLEEREPTVAEGLSPFGWTQTPPRSPWR